MSRTVVIFFDGFPPVAARAPPAPAPTPSVFAVSRRSCPISRDAARKIAAQHLVERAERTLRSTFACFGHGDMINAPVLDAAILGLRRAFPDAYLLGPSEFATFTNGGSLRPYTPNRRQRHRSARPFFFHLRTSSPYGRARGDALIHAYDSLLPSNPSPTLLQAASTFMSLRPQVTPASSTALALAPSRPPRHQRMRH